MFIKGPLWEITASKHLHATKTVGNWATVRIWTGESLKRHGINPTQNVGLYMLKCAPNVDLFTEAHVFEVKMNKIKVGWHVTIPRFNRKFSFMVELMLSVSFMWTRQCCQFLQIYFVIMSYVHWPQRYRIIHWSRLICFYWLKLFPFKWVRSNRLSNDPNLRCIQIRNALYVGKHGSEHIL